MGIRCDRTKEMVGMEGVVSMVVYLITGMMILMLVGGIVWSLYMAIWGVYDEY